MNWNALWQSRKFKVLLVDTVVSLITYIVSNFFPSARDSVLGLIAIMQPLFLVMIGAVAYEDGQALKAGAHITQQFIASQAEDKSALDNRLKEATK